MYMYYWNPTDVITESVRNFASQNFATANICLVFSSIISISGISDVLLVLKSKIMTTLSVKFRFQDRIAVIQKNLIIN